MRLRFSAATALVACLAPLVAPGCSAKTTGQLVLVVQTDLSLPKDIDAIEIDVSVDGVPKFKNSYEKVGTPDGQIHLPGTIDLLAPDDPSQAVDIIVSARSGGKVGILRILDEVVTTVPADRAATLQVPLQFLCDGQATIQAGNPVTTCPKGQTCQAGTCVTNKIDPSSLPTYSEEAVFGDGSCFDVARCFDDAPIADVDPAACTIAGGSHHVNIALETQGDGICGAIGCFVALDANDPLGWTVRSDGKIQLPPAVCPKLANGVITHVVAAPVTAKCKQKVVNLPTCGPWSNAKKQPPPFTGPVALAGGQAGPASLTLQTPSMQSGEPPIVVWTNTGATGAGAVKSVNVAGGTPTPIATMTAARDVAATPTLVFWTNAGKPGSGTISKWDGTNATSLVTGLDLPEGLTLAGGSIFWTEFDSGSIFTASLTGQNKMSIATANYPYRIVSDDRYVYWTNEGTASTTPPDGSVARYDFIANGPAETLASQQAIPRAIALELDGASATSVYWANFAEDGEIVRKTLSGGQPQVLVHGLKRPNGIAIDATDVYWTNRGDGTVMTLPRTAKPGDQPTTIATGQAAPGAIAVDDDAVYWINAGPSDVSQGAIVKLAKGQ